MHKKLVRPYLALLLAGLAACAPHPEQVTALPAPTLTDGGSRYRPVSVARGIPVRPGTVAWSPDGTKLAFIGADLTVLEPATGGKKSFAVPSARTLAWASGNSIYLLAKPQSAKGTTLVSLDLESSALKEFPLARDAVALFPSPGGRELVLLSLDIENYSFGSQITTAVSMITPGSEGEKVLYRSERTSMIKKPDPAFWSAWSHAGLSSLDGSVLILQHVTPPAVHYYTKVTALDPATGLQTDISDLEARNSYFSATWSPDGRRVVLTGSQGLEVRNIEGKGRIIEPAGRFAIPSWNPRGSRIYIAGDLIDSDGRNREALMMNGEKTIGFWSPDGASLVVNAAGELLLFRTIPSKLVPPDRLPNRMLSEKLMLLKNLLSEGIITREEYQTRRARLINQSEEPR